MSELNLNTLTIEELKEQARIMDIELKGNPSAHTIRTRIQEAMGEAKKEKPAPITKHTKRIILAEDATNNQPVYVGYNGISYRIRRGEPVDVPAPLVEILDHAMQSVPVRDRDGRIDGWKKVHAYPFQIVG